MFMYKINFLNLDENNWHGSKICLKKNLKSPQWLRNLKFKKYPFWRIDKPKNITNLVAEHSSLVFSRNVESFLNLIIKEDKVNLDLKDEIIKSTNLNFGDSNE